MTLRSGTLRKVCGLGTIFPSTHICPRKMHQDHTCTSRLCYCCTLQPRRKPHRFVCLGWSHVGHKRFGYTSCNSLTMALIVVYGTRRLGNVSKHWQRDTTLYGTSHLIYRTTSHSHGPIVNTYSSLLTPSTSSRLRTIVQSVCGITRHRDA